MWSNKTQRYSITIAPIIILRQSRPTPSWLKRIRTALKPRQSDCDNTAPEIIAALRGMTLNIIPGEGYRPDFTRTDLTDSLHEIAGFRTDTEIVTNQRIKQIIRGIKNCQD